MLTLYCDASHDYIKKIKKFPEPKFWDIKKSRIKKFPKPNIEI